MKYLFLSIGIFFILFCNTIVLASDWDEFKVKRENNFEFVTKPTITKKENSFVISFETKSFCDVTIAIENKSNGKILRHLVSGVLGKNAPTPLKPNSKKQSIAFDGKDDAGKYIKEFSDVQVRVSLGLKPVFDKSLFDEPKRRHSIARIQMATHQDGVYVYDGGNGIDFVKLYDFDGNYKKTIYPFPANKIKEIKNLKHKELPSKDGKYPAKVNFLGTSFLRTGSNYALNLVTPTIFGSKHYGMYGKAASFIAVSKKNITIGMGHLARLDNTGGSGGLDFHGPQVGPIISYGKDRTKAIVPPTSVAFSPNGKKLYLAGYHYCVYGKASGDIITSGNWKTQHMVYELDYNSNEKPKVFLGNPNKPGNDNKSFNLPISVTTDEKGNVYVCDYFNDRVQVFSAEKKILKSIPVKRPTYITILPNTKETIVISYTIATQKNVTKNNPTTLTKLGKFPNLKAGKPILLPKEYGTKGEGYLYSGTGFPISTVLSDNNGKIRLWVSKELTRANRLTRTKGIRRTNIKIWELTGTKFKLINDFSKTTKEKFIDSKPVYYSRERIQYNPKDKHLYCTKTIHGFNGKSFKHLYKINVSTGKISIIDLPFDAEDFCFDNSGYLYLKSIDIVARYDPSNMREVPWDYGIEIKTATSSSSDRKLGSVISGIKTPVNSGWHSGGIYVNAKGDFVISGATYADNKEDNLSSSFNIYKGRAKNSKTVNLIHIYDKYGKLIKSDVVPGLRENYGVAIDSNKNIYMMNASTRVLDGKAYPDSLTGTIIKFPATGGRIIKKGTKQVSVPLDPSEEPKRPVDLKGAWAENASWFYGGVGFSGKNGTRNLLSGTGCACWNARMTFDYFNRTFAPELNRFKVAVLDSNGNLILNIGRYGNRDTAGDKGSVKVGGDGVTLMHGAYLATHSDKRLFIADPGNDRIVVVKLNYHQNEILSLPEK
ncbi:MAG: hypothetical protein COA79_12365 [Planctomycetota bacterium]|nr:MAG: hypothetical protein COA79_12365 [Planctomycetota bacterium]